MFWIYRASAITILVASITADFLDIYNTKLATSDLQWDKYSRNPNGGWEEVSSFDGNYRSTIRSYQVCDKNFDQSDNWIRSPFIPARGGNQIYVEVEYSITRCETEDAGGEKSTCKETFNIFYYEADSHVASSTFPPWQEHPYKKVDTVAANTVGGMNSKTFNFGPISRKGFYIAIQDQGACMSLISLRVYYYYCPETTQDLVDYPRTVSESGVASLTTATGKCTANSVSTGEQEPQYRCSSDGQWQIPTGKCLCMAGFQPNYLGSDCFDCPTNTFKLLVGNDQCAPCPSNSGQSLNNDEISISSTHNQCPCRDGFARAPNENISVPCAGPPSQPLNLKVAHTNATTALLRWSPPRENGGRSDIYYMFTCRLSLVSSKDSSWDPCPNTHDYSASSSPPKIAKTFIQISHLLPYRKYRITVYARNGAFAALNQSKNVSSASSVEFQTDQAAPSMVKKLKVTKQSTTSIYMTWKEPDKTNGVILMYEVEIWQTNDDLSKPASEALPNTIMTNQPNLEVSNLLQNTEYKIRVRAKTSAGFGPYSALNTVRTRPTSQLFSSDQQPPLSVILVIILLCLLLLGCGIVITFRYRKTGKLLCLRTTRRKKKEQDELLNGIPLQEPLLQERLIVDLPPPDHRTYVDYPDPHAAITQMGFEISPKSIKVGHVIGSGEFAEVCRGEMVLPNNSVIEIAVKRLKEGASAKDQLNFLREASTMAQFNDPNIISLKGVVTKNEPVMIVTEYMENKSLDGYVRVNQGKLTIIQLVKMLEGIASGMCYLSNINYIHRDLAARNILVDQDLNCKVSDFGLSRTLENNPHATYTTQGGKIAIRWTALESILFRKFTSASDVWSYGIVMWEVTSYGEKPYWDMSNDDVIKNLQSGMRLPAPLGCPKVLHEMMISCWVIEPQARPNFSEIAGNLKSLLRQPSSLLPDVAREAAALPTTSSIQNLDALNLGKAVGTGEVTTVENWLETQRLEKYSDIFRKRGVDNLEKVSNLTINDLKSMGIDVTLHISKLEKGIRTLRRNLNFCTSSPSLIRANSTSYQTTPQENLCREQNGALNAAIIPQRSVFV